MSAGEESIELRTTPSWRTVAEPHAVDRVPGAPLVEPLVVGEI